MTDILRPAFCKKKHHSHNLQPHSGTTETRRKSPTFPSEKLLSVKRADLGKSSKGLFNPNTLRTPLLLGNHLEEYIKHHTDISEQTNYHQQHFLVLFRELDDFFSRSSPDVRRKELFAVSSSSNGKQVFRIKSNTSSTFSPVFALVSKKGFSLKLLLGLLFFSFCSSANLSPADEGIPRESLVTRSALVPTTTTRQFGSEASNSCKWRSWSA